MRRRGWKTSARRRRRTPTSCSALIDARDARRAAGLPDVTFEHVKGHAGHRLNGWADERAVRASQHGNRGLAAIWSTDRGQAPIDVTADAPKAGEDKPGPETTCRPQIALL